LPAQIEEDKLIAYILQSSDRFCYLFVVLSPDNDTNRADCKSF